MNPRHVAVGKKCVRTDQYAAGTEKKPYSDSRRITFRCLVNIPAQPKRDQTLGRCQPLLRWQQRYAKKLRIGCLCSRGKLFVKIILLY